MSVWPSGSTSDITQESKTHTFLDPFMLFTETAQFTTLRNLEVLLFLCVASVVSKFITQTFYHIGHSDQNKEFTVHLSGTKNVIQHSCLCLLQDNC